MTKRTTRRRGRRQAVAHAPAVPPEGREAAESAAGGAGVGGAPHVFRPSARLVALWPVPSLAVLVLVSFVPAFWAGFVWDDNIILTSKAVQDGWDGLWRLWFAPGATFGPDDTYEGHYWPLLYSTFWLEHKLWGHAAVGYHAVNVGLHLANTVLLWRLLRRLQVPGAWFAAALFAVHPVHVESVVWVIERKDVLSALFYIVIAHLWVRDMEGVEEGAGRRASRYAFMLALFVAGMLTKSVVVTLPAALVVLHWWRDGGRVSAGALARIAPFLVLGVAIALADTSFYRARESITFDYSLMERVLIAARAFWLYAGKLLWPVPLPVVYPPWEVGAADLVGWAGALAALALVAALWVFRGRVGRGPLAGIAFFVIALSPVLGFVDYGYMQFAFVADRYQYLASIGVLAVLGSAVARGGDWVQQDEQRARWGLPAAGALSIAVLVVLGTLTWRQAGIYEDGIAFFSHIIAHNPEARGAHSNLAKAFEEAGRLEESVAVGRVASRQEPDHAGHHASLGALLGKLERYEEAERHLRRALELEPDDGTSLKNLVVLLRLGERHEEAVAAGERLLALNPQGEHVFAIRVAVGLSLYSLKRFDEAERHLRAALELEPDNEGLLKNLLLVLKAGDRYEEVIAAGRRLLEHHPRGEYATETNADVGFALIALKRHGEAERHLRAALELDPRHKGARHNLAEALRLQKRDGEAVEQFAAVLELDPDFALAHAGMADSLHRLGRAEEARRSIERALELAPEQPAVQALRRRILGAEAGAGTR